MLLQKISLPAPLPGPVPVKPRAKATRCSGFATGTLVRTLAGDRPVETLFAGDLLIDAGGRPVTLRGRQCRRLSRAALVRIMPGALDPAARLDRDLVVGADQPVVHADWRTRLLSDGAAAVAAWRLVDDMLITAEEQSNFQLWSLILDRPATLRINGLRVAIA